jgi:hypothetical protein
MIVLVLSSYLIPRLQTKRNQEGLVQQCMNYSFFLTTCRVLFLCWHESYSCAECVLRCFSAKRNGQKKGMYGFCSVSASLRYLWGKEGAHCNKGASVPHVDLLMVKGSSNMDSADPSSCGVGLNGTNKRSIEQCKMVGVYLGHRWVRWGVFPSTDLW